MFFKFHNDITDPKVWSKQYGRCKHITDYKLPKGHGAKRKQKRKAQRAARKVKP